MKRCSCCKIEKATSDFNKYKSSPDGLQSRCRECSAATGRARYHANVEQERARVANYRERNPNARREYEAANAERIAARRAAAWAARGGPLNPGRVSAMAKLDRAKNPEKFKLRIATWQRANADKVRANTARRKARKLQATPVWANKDRIAAFYTSADALGMLLGEWYHVDHIVPLQGRTVCGLHNEFNLQILPAAENIAKLNRHWPDQP